MDNKRQIIAKKVDKFVFNAKHLNIIISAFLALFVIMFFVCYSRQSAYIDAQNQKYQKLLDEISEYQLNVIYSNVSPNDGYVDTSKEVEEPMFRDAKEAVVYAFDKLNNYKSYEIVSGGMNYSEAVSQKIEIRNDCRYIKYEDGLELEIACSYETKTNFGQSAGEQNVYVNGGKYQRSGSNVRLENGKATADFSGSFSKTNSPLQHIPHHVVNNQTVRFKNSFSFVRDKNNKIVYYKASVSLDPELSTIYYGQNVKEQGGTSFPVYSKVILSCIIDRDGNLLSYEIDEIMKVTKKVLIDIDATVDSQIIYTLVSHDTTPSVPRPQI